VRIGRMAILEAIRLDVMTLALAPEIKDAGVTFPGANVSTSIATGMFQALRTAARLHELGFAERPKLAHVSLLAGHETLPIAQEGLRVAMDRVPPL